MRVVQLLARQGLPARTPHTITDPDRFLAELDAVLTRGYAVDNEEEELGVRCVAVPVHMTGGAMSMSISGPQSRLDEDRIAALVPDLRRIAATASDGAQGATPAELALAAPVREEYSLDMLRIADRDGAVVAPP